MVTWKPGHETTVDYSVPGYPKVARPTYEGATLGVRSREERVMSDVWALVSYARVWDGEKIVEVSVGTDMGPAYADVTVDATDAVKAAVQAFEAVAAAKHAVADADATEYRMLQSGARLEQGKDVKVVRGRKVPLGTRARVFWYGTTQFGPRVGLELADGSRVFTATTNVEVESPESYVDAKTLADVRARKVAAEALLVTLTEKAATLAKAA